MAEQVVRCQCRVYELLDRVVLGGDTVKAYLASRSRKMIPPDVMATFVVAAGLLALAPGPDNVFVLMQSAVNGPRSGIVVVLGLCTGLVVHSTAVALGLAALIKASPMAFAALKFVGAAYLLFLAYKAFRAHASGLTSGAQKIRHGALYWRGVVMNVTNPKVAIFFLAFFPQFMSPDYGPVALQVAQLGLAFMVMAFVIFSIIAVAAGGLSRWMVRTPKAEVWINRVAGAVFVGLAAKLAAG